MGLALRVPSGLTVLCLGSSNLTWFRQRGISVSTPETQLRSHISIPPSVHRQSPPTRKYVHRYPPIPCLHLLFPFQELFPSFTPIALTAILTHSLQLPSEAILALFFKAFPSQEDQFLGTKGFHWAKTAQRSICKRISYVLRRQMRGKQRAKVTILITYPGI